jgi:hypothetical protein
MNSWLSARPTWPIAPFEVLATDGSPRPGVRCTEARPRGDRSKIRIGYEIAPVPLDLRGKNRVLVGLGSYIVNTRAADTTYHDDRDLGSGGDVERDGADAALGARCVAAGHGFVPSESAGLQPACACRPADLTFEQFAAAIRAKAAPDGARRLLPRMPWPQLRKMNDGDLRAVYEYLRAVPPRCANSNSGP